MDKVVRRNRKPVKQRVRLSEYMVKCPKIVRTQDMNHHQWLTMSAEQQLDWLYWAVCQMLGVGSCYLNWSSVNTVRLMKRSGSQALFLASVKIVSCDTWYVYSILWRLKFTRHNPADFMKMLQDAESRHKYYTCKTIYPWYRLTYEYIIKVTGMTGGGQYDNTDNTSSPGSGAAGSA